MNSLLSDQPLLLLFAVGTLGYLLGLIRIGGSRLGVAAVLFAGLAAGAFNPSWKLPESFQQLGLALFVYPMGLASASGLLAALRRDGLRDAALTAGVLIFSAGLAYGLHQLFQFSPEFSAGLYCGSLTNTPALAAVSEQVQHRIADPSAQSAAVGNLVAGYSVAYPVGVLGVIVVLVLAGKLDPVNHAREAEAAGAFAVGGELERRTVRITRIPTGGPSLPGVLRAHGWPVVFGRLHRGGEVTLAGGDTVFAIGDIVGIVGTADSLQQAADALGETLTEAPGPDLTEFEHHYLFVSNPETIGRSLAELDLRRRIGALVTRVRRGDTELPGLGSVRLAPGDQVRVVVHRDRMSELRQLFGDSYRAVSEVDLLTFHLGLAGGILLGLIPLPLPGGVTLKLGLAGGPLLVGLMLGVLGRTGPLNWNLPFGANTTLRQLGLVLFLAAVGTRGGYAFVQTAGSADGLMLLLAGGLITIFTTAATVLLARAVFGLPMGLTAGLVSGVHTHPALLSYTLERAGNELPNAGYASAFPVATLVKIVLAQALFLSLV